MNRILLYINLLLSFISSSQVNNSKVSPVHSGTYSSNSISYVVGKIYVVPKPTVKKKDEKDEDDLLNNSITIYPNPVNDIVTIKTFQQAEIKVISIIDMNGKIIYSSKIENNSADLSFLARGFYIVILDNDNTKTFKIIKN